MLLPLSHEKIPCFLKHAPSSNNIVLLNHQGFSAEHFLFGDIYKEYQIKTIHIGSMSADSFCRQLISDTYGGFIVINGFHDRDTKESVRQIIENIYLKNKEKIPFSIHKMIEKNTFILSLDKEKRHFFDLHNKNFISIDVEFNKNHFCEQILQMYKNPIVPLFLMKSQRELLPENCNQIVGVIQFLNDMKQNGYLGETWAIAKSVEKETEMLLDIAIPTVIKDDFFSFLKYDFIGKEEDPLGKILFIRSNILNEDSLNEMNIQEYIAEIISVFRVLDEEDLSIKNNIAYALKDLMQKATAEQKINIVDLYTEHKTLSTSLSLIGSI